MSNKKNMEKCVLCGNMFYECEVTVRGGNIEICMAFPYMCTPCTVAILERLSGDAWDGGGFVSQRRLTLKKARYDKYKKFHCDKCKKIWKLEKQVKKLKAKLVRK